jgi:AcrR family transcriptional regulator
MPRCLPAGIAAISMQRVADEFGVTAMSLYRYVPSRNELLDITTDLAPQLTATGRRSALDTWTRQVYAVRSGHPWLIEAITRPQRAELAGARRRGPRPTRLIGPERADRAGGDDSRAPS